MNTLGILKAAFILVLAMLAGATGRAGNLEIDLESGAVFSGYNDIRIPNETGTDISLTDDFKSDTEIYYRIKLNYRAGDRHFFSALYAPLTVDASGVADDAVSFEYVDFPAGSEITAKYVFNSYRLTYRYTVADRPDYNLGLGFTAKIRDAEVSLKSRELKSVKENVGFVPLVSFHLALFPDRDFGLVIDGDALAAPQGRAEDVLAAVTYKIYPNAQLRAGYRILEGGADVDEVYSFALLHYLSLGVKISF